MGQADTPNRMGGKGNNNESTARLRVRAYNDDKTTIKPIPLDTCPWCGVEFGKCSLTATGPCGTVGVFNLQRHIFKHPFDAASGSGSASGIPLYQHLIDRVSDIKGSYTADQESVLRNDLRHLLRPYGFSPEIKGRPDSLHQGYAIGTALLSTDQLLEVHSLLKASMERLSDASQKPLLLTLADRLRRAGLLSGNAARRNHGRRALAHRSFTEERSGTLAARDQSERIERAMERLERLLHICGGLYFGQDIEGQLAVMPAEEGGAEGSDNAQAQAPTARRAIPGSDWFDTLRFSCTPQVFQLIREEPNRFPPEHTAYSRPIPGQSSWSQAPLDSLAPNPATDSHPYPVELLLPRWTLESDWDLRSWLFRWGAGVRVESPQSLREQHLQQARGVVELYETVEGI